MDVRPIRTDAGRSAALADIEHCWGVAEGSEACDQLDILVALGASYKARRWPIAASNSLGISYVRQ